MKKKTLKGFTLVELLVVVAIFGMLMAAALTFLMPVKRLFNMSDRNNDVQMISEDLRLFIEDNIQYADRMAVYTNMDIPDAGAAVSVVGEVEKFRKKYYFEPDTTVTPNKERIYPYKNFVGNDEVYVLKIDNPDKTVIDAALAQTNTVTWKSGPQTAAGRYGTVTLSRYKNGSLDTSYNRTWAWNADYYTDYAFNISLTTLRKAVVSGTELYRPEALDNKTYDPTSMIIPTNFAMKIDMFSKVPKNGAAYLNDEKLNRVVSFKLKNIVDAAGNMMNEMIDFQNTMVPREEVARYVWYDNNAALSSAKLPGAADSNDIMIIFTKSPVVENCK